jgi:CheY-like chemotaxis protein
MGRKSGECVTEFFGGSLSLKYPRRMVATPFAPKPLVLLVNDDEATRRLTKMALRGAGCSCCDVGDVEAGWKMLETMGVDALVVDMAKQGEGGLKFVGQLRAAGMRQPIVYLADVPIQELDLVHEAGTFTALVRKPVDLAHLVGVLREGLADSSGRDKGA